VDETLPVLIETAGRTIAPAGGWKNEDEAWSRSMTLLLRLCAIRLAHPTIEWEKLIRDFRAVLDAPVAQMSVRKQSNGMSRQTDEMRSIDAVRADADRLWHLIDDTLASYDSSGQQTLSLLYEDALNLVPVLSSRNGSGQVLTPRLRDRSKKRGGSFYSPPHLVSLVVESALSWLETLPIEAIEKLKIVDPAMGAGVFLIHAYRFTLDQARAQLQSHSRARQLAETLARKVLHGVDLDPLAVEVARLSLWLEVGNFSLNPAIDFPNLQVGNSLIGCRRDQVEADSQDNLSDELDRWCARWFTSENQPYDLEAIRNRYKFFHWQTEFPEVFDPACRANPGFDAVIGNPPWEIEKPNSREFFGAIKPDYWTLGKQQALKVQQQLLDSDAGLSSAWRARLEEHKLFAKFIKTAPVQTAGAVHSFHCQGSGDINLYKLFSEQSYYLARNGGTIALVVPSGIYADSGARDLRRLLIEKNEWINLIGFENSDSTFDIHRSFKYCIFIARKGGRTNQLRTTFSGQSCLQNISSIERRSPKWLVLPEVENEDALSLIEKIYDRSEFLGDIKSGGNSLKYKREFDMTLDSHLFRGRDELENDEYVQDLYGNWLKGRWRPLRFNSYPAIGENRPSSGDHVFNAQAGLCAQAGLIYSACGKFQIALEDVGDLFVPLYEGRMVGQFSANDKHWISGKGRRAEWSKTRQGDADSRILGPQYLVQKNVFLERCDARGLKTGFLAVGCATNARTMIAASLSGVACGNAVPVLRLTIDGFAYVETQLVLAACLNSFVFDYVIRRKMAGNNLNYFVLEECPLPKFRSEDARLLKRLAGLVASLGLNHYRFSRELFELGYSQVPCLDSEHRQDMRALIDVLVAHLYGLGFDDLQKMLSDPILNSGKVNSKGFFRMDRELPVEKRLPARVLSLARETAMDDVDALIARTDWFTVGNDDDGDLASHAGLIDRLLH
jgi:hypothetical protein